VSSRLVVGSKRGITTRKIAAAAATARPINKITAITGEIARFLLLYRVKSFKHESLHLTYFKDN
jgi:hypothetical protein